MLQWDVETMSRRRPRCGAIERERRQEEDRRKRWALMDFDGKFWWRTPNFLGGNLEKNAG